MADVESLLQALTLEERAALTAGEDMFSTVAVDRLGIPKIGVTDGPSGARGLGFPGLGGEPSSCIPCGSAIGATWDPTLAEELGALVGREALDRGCRGLLAPTVNLHRSPLAGRNFECYSEDPLLSGRLAAGCVRGVQSAGVFATVKHFVGNDAEFERNSISSIIDRRSLRELYLVPFEMAIREGGALAVMTSYNRLNGRWLTEQPEFLTRLLREEWGFEGLVMTDWFAVVDRNLSLGAGLDLEMPGPARALGVNVLGAIDDGVIDKADLDAAVGRLLSALNRIGALDAPPPRVNPQPTRPEDVSLLRRAAADATVLLTNDGTLPLDPGSLLRVAVVGHPAVRACMVGGGSAEVVEHRVASPRQALSDSLPEGATVTFERGCEVDRSPTPVGRFVLLAPGGFEAEIYGTPDLSGEVVARRNLQELRLVAFGSVTEDWPVGDWSMRVRGRVVAEEAGTFQLALAQSGRARVLLDGQVLLDGFVRPPPPGGTDFFGQASKDLVAAVPLTAGAEHSIEVQYARTGAVLAGFRVGFRTVNEESLIERAVEAASAADVALVFAGTTAEWETEGRDRPFFQLPGRQDEMIRRVAAANRHTVVVLNAGAPIDLPWVDDVAAVLQCWFGGQEMDHAVADVLTGRAEPGGRLPFTIPKRIEHNPAYDNFPGENGELRYGEGLFMGYRGYEHRCISPRFAFGHGLGYTAFDIGVPTLSSPTFHPGEKVTISVPVTNTGTRPGCEVIQCYVAPPSSRLARPPKELKAFAKIRLAPGETGVVEIVLEDRAFAYWDPGRPGWDGIAARLPAFLPFAPGRSETATAGWTVEPGSYEILIGHSSQAIVARCRVDVGAAEEFRS